MLSGGGSNTRDFLDRLRGATPPLDATVVAVGSDKEAAGLHYPHELGIPTFQLPLIAGESRIDWGTRLIEQIDSFAPDLIILSGFMKLLPSNVVARYAPQILNTHPAYLPEFPGAHAVADALAAGATETGASVIVVDDGVDTGPILARERVPIHATDSEASLHERIKQVERELLWDVVSRVCRGELRLATKEMGNL